MTSADVSLAWTVLGWSGGSLVLGLSAAGVLRRRAAQAHQVLLLAMLASVLMPGAVLLFRQMNWGLRQVVAGPVTATFSPGESLLRPSAAGTRGAALAPTPEERHGVPGAAPSAEPAAVQRLTSGGPSFPWRMVLYGLWGLLSLLLALRLALSFRAGRRLVETARELAGDDAMPLAFPFCLAARGGCRSRAELAAGVGYWHPRPTSPSAAEGAAALGDAVPRTAAGLAQRLGVTAAVRIVETDGIGSPMIWAWSREVVLLVPSGARGPCLGAHWQAVFCHELAHVRRRDHLSGLAAELLCCLLPWQPLLWLARSYLIRLSEEACDDWVAELGLSGPDYAEALLELAPRRQPAILPAMASSRRGLAVRVRRVLAGRYGDPRVGPVWRALVGAGVGLAVVTVALAQTRVVQAPAPEPVAAQPDVPGATGGGAPPAPAGKAATESNAWAFLDDRSVTTHLFGLPQRLGLAVASPPDSPVWRGVAGGGKLEVSIDVEGDLIGPVQLGLFPDAAWTQAPVLVRTLPGPGVYVIDDVPPGAWVVGAMAGKLPGSGGVAAAGELLNLPALGVAADWPRPVAIEKGRTASCRILVSSRFRFAGNPSEDAVEGFAQSQEAATGGNFLQGRVTGPDGQPVPFAIVQLREQRKPGATSIRMSDWGADAQGWFRWPVPDWPYTISGLWYEPMPSVLGTRYRFTCMNEVLTGAAKVDIQLDPFPTGTAALAGRVTDDEGKPVTGFTIGLDTWCRVPEELRRRRDGTRYSVFGFQFACRTGDGTFRLAGLPPGRFGVTCQPLDPSYEGLEGPPSVDAGRPDLTELVDGETVTLNWKFRREIKLVLHGRVLFEDGTPARIEPPPYKDAATRVGAMRLMPDGRSLLGLGKGGSLDQNGRFVVSFTERELEMLKSGEARLAISLPGENWQHPLGAGQFPLEKLAKDPAQAGVVLIPRPGTDRARR